MHFFKCLSIKEKILSLYPIILNEHYCHCIGIDVKLSNNRSLSIFFKRYTPQCCGTFEFIQIFENKEEQQDIDVIEINLDYITFINSVNKITHVFFLEHTCSIDIHEIMVILDNKSFIYTL